MDDDHSIVAQATLRAARGDLGAELGDPSTMASATRRCPRCDRPAALTDVFCMACGGSVVATPAGAASNGHAASVDAHGMTVPAAGAARRRLGGTTWHPIAPPATETGEALAPSGRSAAGPASITPPSPVARTRRRRRRRSRRTWTRRVILGTPVVLVLAVLTAIGMVGYRAESTIATIHELSTPPPVVADHTEGDEPLPSGLAIDPGPAAAAVQSAEAAKNGTSAGADQPTSDDDGDLLGRLKEAAGNTADLAEGAAVAAGVKDPNSAALTLLLMGVDARPGAPIDVGVRPDALAVLRLDPATGACRLLAIPRDTRADLPGYGLTKINHALMVGGVPYQRLVVENLLGISVDGYALVDFVAFQEFVDAVGGVPVDVSEAVTLRDGTDVPAGRQTMDGAQALAYARYRATTGDVGRIKRQWAVLRGLAQVEGSRDLVADVNALLPPVADHVRSDLTATDMAAMAKTHGGSCTADSVEAAVLAGTTIRLDDPLLGQAVTYNVVSDAVVRERVADLLGATSADSGHLAPGTTGARPVGRDTRRH